MRGFLIFSKLNDLLYWRFDEDLSQHFARVAQKHGLVSGELKHGKKVVKLGKDALVHLFSPLVTTQRVMGVQMRNPYTFVKFPSQLGIAFEEVFNSTVICIGSMPEDELRRKATIVRQTIEFLYGPSFETLRSKHGKHSLLSSMIDAWVELRSTSTGFLLEAVERCHITPAANHVVVNVLRDALKCMGEGAQTNSVKPSHAFLLAGYKLIALYSRKGEEDLLPGDFLLTVLLVYGGLRLPSSSGARCVAQVVMLRDSSTGERCLPRCVYAVPLFGDVSVVVMCEPNKDELGAAFIACLRLLDALAKSRTTPATLDLGTEIEKILALAKKIGPPSSDLDRFERHLAAQWETARRNGFDAFAKDYKNAHSRVRTPSRNSSSGESTSAHETHVSLRTRLVRFESLLTVIAGTLQEGFGLCCVDLFGLKDGVDCLEEFVATHARRMLGDFSDFLCHKAALNIDLVAYLEEFPSLIHFMYIDRRTNQVMCPGRTEDVENGRAASVVGADSVESPFARKLKKAVWIVRAHLAKGNHSVLWRDRSFVYSYHLWFENSSGEPLIPRRESKNFASHLPYPGVIGNNFYDVLARECFSTSRPSSTTSPPSSFRSPRVVVKELYCVFSCTGGGLSAEDAVVQAQRIAECLPVMLSSSASPVAFL